MEHHVKLILAIAVLFSGVLAQKQTPKEHDHKHGDHRVNVTVYYESLCPDSIKFFTQQLYPSLQGNLSEFVALTLIPFGRATYKDENNEVKFECKHGPAECKGDKIQACALHKINEGNNTEGLGYNKITTGFINCLMDKVVRQGDNTTFPTQKCAEMNHVDILADIENCAEHSEASTYLKQLGEVTQALQPTLKSVPTIVFNNQFMKEDNDLSQNNFVKALCKHIKDHNVYECTKSGAPTLSLSFAIIMVAIARWFY